MKNLVVASAVALGISSLGCTAELGSEKKTEDRKGSTNGSSGGNPGEATGGPDSMGVSGLRMLSSAEYRNSVRDLLGESTAELIEQESDTQLNGLTSIANTTLAVTERGVELYESNASGLSDAVLLDATGRSSLVGCEPTDATCRRNFVANFGAKAWRRPLAEDEVNRYAAIAEAAVTGLGDAWEGVRYALMGLLQSPSFVYRVELGNPSDPERRLLSELELASRLSYFLTASTPDAALLADAQAGTLTANLSAEATRLLASPFARDAVRTFFGEYLGLGRMDSVSKLGDVFPEFTESLKAAMVEETLQSLTTGTFDSAADFRTILTTKSTFINPELAALYGVSAPAADGFASFTWPDDSPRAGLLGQAAFLSMYAHAGATSPSERGKFVRETLLCQAIAAPPANVNTTLPENTGTTMREKLTQHATQQACAGCHQMMDPIGLGFENFDAIGRYRDTDQGLPIDPSGDLDGAAFAGPTDLAQAIANHPNFTLCVTRTLYRQAAGVLENESQEPLVTELNTSFASASYALKAALSAVVNHDAFRYVAAPLEEAAQ